MMKFLIFLSLLFSTTALMASDSIKRPNWAIYANASLCSMLEFHAGFEKHFGHNKSISFDGAWRHIEQSLPCYPLSFTLRRGGYLLSSYNIHNNVTQYTKGVSGFGLLLGYLYINDYLDGTPCYNYTPVDQKVLSIGFVYTGRIGFKKFPYLELFMKGGVRCNMVFQSQIEYYQYPLYRIGHDYRTGASLVGDLGIRFQFVKFKKNKT